MILLMGSLPWATQSASAQETAATSPLFDRVVVFGASVGAGFDCKNQFGGPQTVEYRFSHYLEAALKTKGEPIKNVANVLLFLQPAKQMEQQLAKVGAAKPTLAIGVDSLFWFCYGAGRTPEKRLEFFEEGLRLLERIDAPLIVGDIPDASRAVGGILSKEEMPPLETIAKCNARLKEWATARGKVTIFPIAEVMARAGADEELKLGGITWAAGKSRALLQQDSLHPARHGLAALAIGVLETAAALQGQGHAADLCRDLETVYTGGLDRARAQAAAAAKAAEAKAAAKTSSTPAPAKQPALPASPAQ